MLEITVDDGIDGTDNIVCRFEDGAGKNIQLLPGFVYTVKLEIPADSASGYSIIKIVDNDGDETNDVKLYSASVSNSGSYERIVSFEMVVGEEVNISLIPCWGLYSGQADIDDGDKISLSATGIVSDSDETASDETATDETATDETVSSEKNETETVVDSESDSENFTE